MTRDTRKAGRSNDSEHEVMGGVLIKATHKKPWITHKWHGIHLDEKTVISRFHLDSHQLRHFAQMARDSCQYLQCPLCILSTFCLRSLLWNLCGHTCFRKITQTQILIELLGAVPWGLLCWKLSCRRSYFHSRFGVFRNAFFPTQIDFLDSCLAISVSFTFKFWCATDWNHILSKLYL